MLASSFGDPVLGIDIHWEFVPTPAGPIPTPIPNPFTGVVFDPVGLAVGLVVSNVLGAVFGAPMQGPVVYWGAIPATNTGTEAKHIPGHILIPPGTSWAPVPKTPKPVIHPGETPSPPNPVKPEDDAISVFGSKTVSVMGSNAVRLGDMWMSCSEPVRMPSSVVLAVPKGAPILIGGPPSLDLMAAVMASLRTRFVSDSLHSLVSRMKPSRFRNFLSRAVCFFTGHPVDVASGKVLTSFVDAELPGPLPLKIERVYSSAFGSRKSSLGYGWSLSLDQAVWRERGKVVYLAEDGREIEFDTFDFPDHTISPGQEVWHPIDRLTLRSLDEGVWEIKSHDGIVREFSPIAGKTDGRSMIKRIRSRCRYHEISFEYDTRGRLEFVRDSSGRLIAFEHDILDRITALKLPHPTKKGQYIHRRFEYDENSDLVCVVDALGASWNFEYVTHLLTRETDRTGLSFYFMYDGFGEDARCVRTWGDGGIYDHLITYDKKNHVTYVTDSFGHTTHYHSNIANLVVKVVDALGGQTTYEYDKRTLMRISQTDPAGRELKRHFNSAGDLVKVVAPNGATTQIESINHHPVRAIDPSGVEWLWQYDQSGHLVERVIPTGQRTTVGWNQGLLIWRTDSPDHRTSFEYDEQKNHVATKLPNGGTERYTWDNLGRMLQIRNTMNGVTHFAYDLESRIVETHSPAGNVYRFSYDAEGNLIKAQDSIRLLTLGHKSRRIIWREEAGARVQFQWDTEGRLTGIVNEGGERYSAKLDPLGNIKEEIDFDGSKKTYERNALGHVTKVSLPANHYRENMYDPGGHLAEVRNSDGTFSRFEYDLRGLVVAAENQCGRIEIDYDAGRRVIAERFDGREVRSNYGADGKRAEISTSLGAFTSVGRGAKTNTREIYFRPINNTISLKHPDVQVEHNVFGRECVRRYGNGIEIDWDWDSNGRPVSRRTIRIAPAVSTDLFTEQSRTEIEAWNYQWRGDNQITAIVDRDKGARLFDYDDRGRLILERRLDQSVERMMDMVGNIYPTADRRSCRYGPGGRLEVAEGIRYEYDELGNQKKKMKPDGTTWKYNWNIDGMLQEVSCPDGMRVQFEYDAFGRRSLKRILGVNGNITHETEFVWDGHYVVHELNSDRKNVTWYWEPDGLSLLAKEIDGSRWMIASDHLGTPTEMYDVNGSLSWQMHMDILGSSSFLFGNAADCPWRWPGQYEDIEHGAAYQGARYYAADRGSFLSKDPAGLFAGLNPYKYVSDPLTWIDLLGLTGTYLFEFDSGESYVGKGPIDRAKASQGIRAREIGGTTDDIARGVHADFGDDKMGLMVEAELMERRGWNADPDNLNRINSPGRKLLDAADSSTKATVKKNADALEDALKKKSGKIC